MMRTSIRGLALLILPLASLSCHTARFRSVAAEWVEERGEPSSLDPDFLFTDLCFVTPGHGWVVGNRYLLHIADGEPSVTLLGERRRPGFTTVWCEDTDHAWAGGYDSQRRAALWRHAGTWEEVPMPPSAAEQIVDLAFPGPSAGFALGLSEGLPGKRKPANGRKLLQSTLFRLEHGQWSVDEPPWQASKDVLILDICAASDTVWAAGVTRTGAGTGKPFLAAWRNGNWRQVALPDIPGRAVVAGVLACAADGRAFAAVQVDPSPTREARRTVFLAHAGAEWKTMEAPPFRDPDAQVSAMAVGDDALWVATCNEVLAYRDRSWHRLPRPPAPGTSTTLSCIEGIHAFGDEAWAIANDFRGNMVRGRLLHFQDGRWRHRNWRRHWGWSDLFGG